MNAQLAAAFATSIDGLVLGEDPPTLWGARKLWQTRIEICRHLIEYEHDHEHAALSPPCFWLERCNID